MGIIGIFIVGLLLIILVSAIYLAIGQARPESVRPSPSLDESNRIKGRKGELSVQQILQESLPPSEYLTFANLYVPTGNRDHKTEVDHVIVSRFGVFAVETKAWPGLINGDEDDEVWVQQLGRAINDKRNPLEQSRRQRRVLAQHLDLHPRYVHGVVCFYGPNTRFANDMPTNVVHANELAGYIRAHRQAVLSDDGVGRVVEVLGCHGVRVEGDWVQIRPTVDPKDA